MRTRYQLFLDRKVMAGSNSHFQKKKLNPLSIIRQVSLVPNPISQSSVVSGRSFRVTGNGLCMSVLLNTLDTKVSIQRGRKGVRWIEDITSTPYQ